jgi:hypothetical protein
MASHPTQPRPSFDRGFVILCARPLAQFPRKPQKRDSALLNLCGIKHHAEVASLEAAEADRLLDWCQGNECR